MSDKFDLVGNIIAYECGELSEMDTLTLFSHLIETGKAWTLQGSYGRMARALIEDGLVDKQGNILVDDMDEEDTMTPRERDLETALNDLVLTIEDYFERDGTEDDVLDAMEAARETYEG